MNTTTNSKLNPVLTFKDLEEAFKQLNKVEKFIDEICIPKEIKNEWLKKIIKRKSKKRNIFSGFEIKLVESNILPKNVIMLGYSNGSNELIIMKEDGIYKWSGETVRKQIEEMLNKGREKLREYIRGYWGHG